MTRAAVIFSILMGVLPGCSRGAAGRRPVRWQLVETRYGDLETHGVAGQGQVDPEARVLVFEPLFLEDLSTEIFVSAYPDPVELIRLSHRKANVGEEVTATVRLREPDPRGIYRLTARGTTPFISVLGNGEFFVKGRETGVFIFTSTCAGTGGIEIAVERID